MDVDKDAERRINRLEELVQYFDKPLKETAQQMGMATSTLKKICRANGIPKWPYRQIRSLDKMIAALESSPDRDEHTEEMIAQLRRKREKFYSTPQYIGTMAGGNQSTISKKGKKRGWKFAHAYTPSSFSNDDDIQMEDDSSEDTPSSPLMHTNYQYYSGGNCGRHPMNDMRSSMFAGYTESHMRPVNQSQFQNFHSWNESPESNSYQKNVSFQQPIQRYASNEQCDYRSPKPNYFFPIRTQSNPEGQYRSSQISHQQKMQQLHQIQRLQQQQQQPISRFQPQYIQPPTRTHSNPERDMRLSSVMHKPAPTIQMDNRSARWAEPKSPNFMTDLQLPLPSKDLNHSLSPEPARRRLDTDMNMSSTTQNPSFQHNLKLPAIRNDFELQPMPTAKPLEPDLRPLLKPRFDESNMYK